MALKATTIILLVIVILLVYVLYNYVKGAKQTTLYSLEDARHHKTFAASDLSTSPTSNYALSIWFYINDWNYKIGQQKVILDRRGKNSKPSPSITLGANKNNITVSMETHVAENLTETSNCVINDVPLQRWTNLIMSINGRALDLYIDGKLVKTCILSGPPKNYTKAPIQVTPDGGFSGYTARLQYFSEPLSPSDAYDIYREGFSGKDSIFAGLNKYKLKFAFLEDNKEVNSFEL